MSCPDEDTFARFVEGLLGPEAAAAIERHVDGCARCADLAAEFGRSYATNVGQPIASERGLAPLALALAAVAQLAWALLLRRAGAPLHDLLPPALAAAYLRYAAFWAPVGTGVALGAALGLLGRWRWARWLAVGYALLSLPSVVMTPIGLFVLHAGRRAREGD
jgi:anti-sigma factor RsiW